MTKPGRKHIKAAKKAAKKRQKNLQREIAKNRCSIEGCLGVAVSKHECLTCEKLGRVEPFTVYGCAGHGQEAVQEARRHALIKHPANLMRGVVAALGGEEVF